MPFVQGYIPAEDWGRVCDVCGRLRPGRGFRVVENIWICDRHPSYVPRQTLDRVPYMELGAPKPLPSAKPWAPLDTYEASEAEVLNLVAAYAPADTLDVTNGAGAPGASTVQAAAWGALYLYDLIVEAKRPTRWVAVATVVLGQLADWLYSHQWGGPTTTLYASTVLQWGAYNRATSGEDFYVEDSAAGGLALLRAYQALGKSKYLDAARACAWFIRSAQCGDKLASRPSSGDSAGSAVTHYGVWTHRILLNAGTYDFDHRYYPGDLVALEFLTAFKDEVGDETISSTTTNAVFSASRAALVSSSIAEALVFWLTGTFSVDDGAMVNGLSSTTPREFFDAYPATKGAFTGRGSWQFQDAAYATGTLVTALGWATAIRALRAVGEASATTLFDWLMTFTSNSAFEAATVSHTYGSVTWNKVDDRATYAGIAGTYSPRVALSTLLKVRTSAGAATAVNGSSLYDLATAGLLAPLYSTRQQTTFGPLKDALAYPRPRWREGFDPRDGHTLYLGPLGVCGLAYQPYTDASLNRYQSTLRAAMVGNIYRYAPQAWTGRGHA